MECISGARAGVRTCIWCICVCMYVLTVFQLCTDVY